MNRELRKVEETACWISLGRTLYTEAAVYSLEVRVGLASSGSIREASVAEGTRR